MNAQKPIRLVQRVSFLFMLISLCFVIYDKEIFLFLLGLAIGMNITLALMLRYTR